MLNQKQYTMSEKQMIFMTNQDFKQVLNALNILTSKLEFRKIKLFPQKTVARSTVSTKN